MIAAAETSQPNLYLVEIEEICSTTYLPQSSTGSQPQKGVTTYALSANRQKLFAGAMNAAVFNTYRRSRGQVMYFVPWGFALYFIIDWAEKRYV